MKKVYEMLRIKQVAVEMELDNEMDRFTRRSNQNCCIFHL
ncbi:hypothetical protein J1TS3_12110 [Siminovitchia fordii]|uniref:Uncharacterized protein n=1 Tax=Siminovitchia fordii TaxID=254759 RepID=A0ABQ4K2T8_9BACI|nr:hypothetical protein J1TS3_12110 [Siminovitchia fordii]